MTDPDTALHDAVVRMGHDIVRNLAHKDHNETVEAVSAHILKFWEPRMREELQRCVHTHDDDIHPTLADAVRSWS